MTTWLLNTAWCTGQIRLFLRFFKHYSVNLVSTVLVSCSKCKWPGACLRWQHEEREGVHLWVEQYEAGRYAGCFIQNLNSVTRKQLPRISPWAMLWSHCCGERDMERVRALESALHCCLCFSDVLKCMWWSSEKTRRTRDRVTPTAACSLACPAELFYHIIISTLHFIQIRTSMQILCVAFGSDEHLITFLVICH